MRLIRGAPGTGRTSLVFREFKAALRSGRRDMRLVVPTATLVRHFQHELARDGAVLPPGSVISLSRFAFERAPDCRLVPDGLLRAIVRDALRRLQPAEFAEVSGTEGMTSTLLETIALFENAGCTVDQLSTIGRRLTPHGKAFGKIWREVDRAVAAAGYHSRVQVLRAAAANTTRIPVWMDGFLNFSPAEREWIAALAKSCDLTLTLSDARGADEIRRFALSLGAEERLLTGAARRPGATIVAATSPEREADEIARRILSARAAGTEFREIGVALRDASSYLPLLQGTLERFGIPARFYFAAPLRRHPAAVFLGGLVHNVLTGWEFGAALETLQAHPAWGSSAAFDRFDFKVREAMPGAGATALLALCEEDFTKRLSACLALDTWRDDVARPRDWAHRLEQMAERLYRPGMLTPAADHTALAMERSQTAALGAWVDSVSSATAFWADQEAPVSLAEFWRVAEETLQSASVPLADDRRDVVHVMSVYEARQWDVSMLFVCGMTDRDFPKRNPPNLLFPDGDIEPLRKAGIPLRKAADQDREEAHLWEALKTRAQDALILTYPEHDAGGRSTHSSRYLTEIQADIQTARLSRATPAVVIESAGLAGHIEPPDLLNGLAAQHRRISLTALEDLTQCRFKFFAGRTLNLRARPERPQERLQPKITGLILHEALEAWLNNNRQGDFVDLFETAFDKMVREKHLPPGYRLEVERINLRAIAGRVSATEQWTPLSSEAEVELTLDFPGGITVACRVDRIDHMSETDCIILDYKSSKTVRVEQMVESQVKLQGPLYALAVREKLHLNTLAMMYVAVREDKRFGWGEVPGANLELKPIPPNWIDAARDRSIERIESFLGGAVHAEPAEPDSCRWCDFQHGCRVEQKALVMIAGHEPVVQGD